MKHAHSSRFVLFYRGLLVMKFTTCNRSKLASLTLGRSNRCRWKYRDGYGYGLLFTLCCVFWQWVWNTRTRCALWYNLRETKHNKTMRISIRIRHKTDQVQHVTEVEDWFQTTKLCVIVPLWVHRGPMDSFNWWIPSQSSHNAESFFLVMTSSWKSIPEALVTYFCY